MAKKAAKKASSGAKKASPKPASAKKQLYTVSALTKGGAVALAKTYRDKIGAKIHGEVFSNENSGLWSFLVELPFE